MADISKIKIPSNTSVYNIKDTTARNNAAINLSSIGISKKNLLKPLYKTTQTGGCTFTVNDDKSVTVSGKNDTGSTIFFPIIMPLKLPLYRTYTLNGCPSNNKTDDGKTKVYWRVEKPAAIIAMDTGNGATFTANENLNPTYAQICVNSGADFTDNPCTFYPMLRYADITDDTYEPYQDDLQTQINNDIALNLSSIGMSKKNLLKNTAVSKSVNGITFTVNDDKSITVNGTNTSSDNVNIEICGLTNFGNKKLTATIGSTDPNVYLTLYNSSWGDIKSTDEFGIVTWENKNVARRVRLIIKGGASVDNVTFYPMIRYANITDDTYEPYTEDLQTQINNDIALNLSSIGMSKKNLLKIVEINKITDKYSIIKNSDDSVTVNGTFDTNISATLGTLKTKNGVKYILSGCPQGGSSSSYRLNMRHEGQTTNVYPDIGGGVTFTGIDETMSAIVLIYGGTTVDNLTFYPMIRYADITDDTYEPYQDNLQTQIKNNDNDIALNLSSIGMSKKNLLKNNATTKSVNNVTYTVNSNGSVTVKNTETTPGNATIDINTNFKLNPGTYILTGDKEIRSVGEIRISVGGKVYSSYNTPFTITETSTVSYVRIYVFQDHNLGGTATVYPMLRYADITDNTYEPYREDLQTQINNILARLTAAGI